MKRYNEYQLLGAFILGSLLASGSCSRAEAKPMDYRTAEPRLERALTQLNEEMEDNGEQEFDVSELCNSKELTKEYGMIAECAAFEAHEAESELDCENPRDTEERSGCNAAE